MKKLLDELRRRNVIRTTSVYAGIAWLVIGVGDVALPLIGAPEWVLPAVIVCAVIGLPFTIVLAWFFQTGPGGIELDTGVRPPPSGRSAWDVVVIGILLGALSVSVYVNLTDSTLFQGRWSAPPSQSLAVLPFRDLSPGRDQAYLSDGIAEELLNALSRFDGLRVISRTSSFVFRASDLGIAEIADRLKVAHVIEGSVRTVGDVVRITVQLIDARTESNRWSLTYERTLDDVFALQDEIAADVSSEFRVSMRAQGRARQRVGGEAYTLVLRARHLARQFTEESLTRADELLARALALKPDYIDALNVRSGVYATQAGEGFIPQRDGIDAARAAADQVLAVDPHNAEALAALAWLAMRYDNDLPAAAEYLQRALKLDLVNTGVLGPASGLLFRMGRLDEAIALAETLAELDPLTSFGFANLGVYRLFAGRLDEAIEAYETALELSPGFVGAHYAIGVAHLLRGEPEAALAAMQRESDEEFRTKGMAMAYHDLGRQAEFEEYFGVLKTRWGNVWRAEVAEVYAYVGDMDSAFEWIELDLAASGGRGWAETVLNPTFKALRDDPRWGDVLERLNVAPAQLAAIPFEVPARIVQDAAHE